MTTPTPTLRHPDTGFEQPVERLDGVLDQTRGAIGRGVGSGLWFDFDDAMWRWLHMVGVGEPIVAVWIDGREVTHVKRLRPWTGLGVGAATDIVELPAAAAPDDLIEPGSEVVLG